MFRAIKTLTWPRFALLTLVAAGLALNFLYGIHAGERDALFYPMFRTRVTLAIALSMMRSPATTGYVAYDDINAVLVSRGFYLGEDNGDSVRRAALFKDSNVTNRALEEALYAPLDVSKKTIILPGNDLGAVDFTFIAFRLFGVKISSLYYLYFLLLAASAAAFAVQFWRSRFMILLLNFYLALHLLIMEWAQEVGPAVGSVSNSRTFTLLGFLPALHMTALLVSRPPVMQSLAPAFIQAATLAFLVTCRLDVLWEVGFVLLGAICFLPGALKNTGPLGIRFFWPAALLLGLVAVNFLRLNLMVAPSYHQAETRHLVWENLLTGLLANRDLRLKYAQADANDPHSFDRTDLKHMEDWRYGSILVPEDLEVAGCESVKSYLRHKRDARGFPGSQLVCDLEQGRATGHSRLSFADYDLLALRVSIIIISEHPLQALGTVLEGLGHEIVLVHSYYRFTAKLILAPLAIIITAVAIYWLSTRAAANRLSEAPSVFVVAILALACALLELTFAGSPHVSGAIATCLLGLLLGLTFGIVWASFMVSKAVRLARRKAKYGIFHKLPANI
jgi:hypothetical protein